LLVDQGAGVHVNGRPVRRCALLRAGDSVHLGGQSILLQGQVAVAPRADAPAAPGQGADVRRVMRAIGGRHHGRAFALGRGCLVGSDPTAAIRLDPPLAGRHARICVEADRVVLRGLDGDGSRVNGNAVRDAELRAGDQVLFGSTDRFVLEAPCAAPLLSGPADQPAGIEMSAGQPARRLPWLLLAALLIAAALSALLLL